MDTTTGVHGKRTKNTSETWPGHAFVQDPISLVFDVLCETRFTRLLISQSISNPCVHVSEYISPVTLHGVSSTSSNATRIRAQTIRGRSREYLTTLRNPNPHLPDPHHRSSLLLRVHIFLHHNAAFNLDVSRHLHLRALPLHPTSYQTNNLRRLQLPHLRHNFLDVNMVHQAIETALSQLQPPSLEPL